MSPVEEFALLNVISVSNTDDGCRGFLQGRRKVPLRFCSEVTIRMPIARRVAVQSPPLPLSDEMSWTGKSGTVVAASHSVRVEAVSVNLFHVARLRGNTQTSKQSQIVPRYGCVRVNESLI